MLQPSDQLPWELSGVSEATCSENKTPNGSQMGCIFLEISFQQQISFKCFCFHNEHSFGDRISMACGIPRALGTGSCVSIKIPVLCFWTVSNPPDVRLSGNLCFALLKGIDVQAWMELLTALSRCSVEVFIPSINPLIFLPLNKITL